MKELKVLELFDKGYPYRQIAKEVHISLRDVANYVYRISNTKKSPSTTSVMDEVVLEYRVNLLRSEIRGLKIESDNLMNGMKDLRMQKYDLLNQLHAKQTELDLVRSNLEYEKFSEEILNGIFTEDRFHWRVS